MSSYRAADVFLEKQPDYDRSLAAFAARKINALELRKDRHRHFVVVRHEEEIVALVVASELRDATDGVHIDTLIVTDEQHRQPALVEVLEVLYTKGYFRFRRRPENDDEYALLTGEELGFVTVGQPPDWTVELCVN